MIFLIVSPRPSEMSTLLSFSYPVICIMKKRRIE